jgi:HD-GYP domain-containing protein (c-di-GMP phosphodiesterase class II)
MTDRRPYREPLSFDAALEELRRGAGSQFDPMVVFTFLNIEEKIRAWLGLI